MDRSLRRKRTFKELLSEHPGMKALQGLPRYPISVLVDNVRSLHNVGSIFRTADATRIEKCYLCGITGCPPRTEIRKASLGAEESVPWEYEKNPLNVVERLKASGYQIVSLEHTTGSLDYREATYAFPLCLVVGHEFNGISDDVIQASDLAVEIPMHGLKLSLNVSVAFGVTVYELVNRLKQKGG